MTTTEGFTFLDCTLRDGGYYTNWVFETGVVNRYLRAMDEAGLDAVEVGFRSIVHNEFLGAYGHTTDRLLGSLELPQRARVGVMVNASELVDHDPRGAKGVDLLFGAASGSPVQLVRIATHLKHVDNCVWFAERLAELGYPVAVNLMQISRYPRDVIAAAAADLEAAGVLSALYFADSLGDMRAADVTATLEILREAWSGPLGFHAHDNRRLGLSNSVAAVEAGCTWVDATVRGMGRGAGNAATEFLLPELARLTGRPYSIDPLVQTVMVDFAALQAQHGWGADFLYLKAAEYGVHPTYIQTLQGDERYELADVVNALETLRTNDGHSYSTKGLEDAVAFGTQHPEGTWSPDGWLADRDVLILGAGPQAALHSEAIEAFITDEKPAVLCLNTRPPIGEHLMSAFVACHPTRITLEASRIGALGRPVVAPRAMLDAVGVSPLGEVDLLDYGMVVEPGRFECSARSCVVPERLAIAYALAVASRGGAKRILLAGFDGYPPGDPRQEQVQNLLDVFRGSDAGRPVLAITPTTYQLAQSSVYAPVV